MEEKIYEKSKELSPEEESIVNANQQTATDTAKDLEEMKTKEPVTAEIGYTDHDGKQVRIPVESMPFILETTDVGYLNAIKYAPDLGAQIAIENDLDPKTTIRVVTNVMLRLENISKVLAVDASTNVPLREQVKKTVVEQLSIPSTVAAELNMSEEDVKKVTDKMFTNVLRDPKYQRLMSYFGFSDKDCEECLNQNASTIIEGYSDAIEFYGPSAGNSLKLPISYLPPGTVGHEIYNGFIDATEVFTSVERYTFFNTPKTVNGMTFEEVDDLNRALSLFDIWAREGRNLFFENVIPNVATSIENNMEPYAATLNQRNINDFIGRQLLTDSQLKAITKFIQQTISPSQGYIHGTNQDKFRAMLSLRTYD
ncbi:MAG: hypothetical protein EBV19_09185, partial [Flavobacteriia bacterium]|nr:hypothetical protein [Flavobacteriia bacterium]